MKKVTISLLSIIAITSVLFAVFLSSRPNNEDSVITNENFIHAITNKYSTLLNNNEPTFKIDSVSAYSNGWYIVTIKSIHEVKNFVPVKVVLLRSSSTLEVILGPDTHFAEADMLSRNLPDSAIMELRKS